MNSTLAVGGYACYFNVVDENNDLILPTAFDNAALSRESADVTHVKFLYQHDITRPIGRWHRIKADSRGLYVQGEIYLDLVDGFSAGLMSQHGLIDGLSIGYKVGSAYRDHNGTRILEDIQLFEISLVTFPMQKDAKLHCIF